ncbi:MAG: DUF5906 domain-containing protein, partial [Imperialibacter sp.]
MEYKPELPYLRVGIQYWKIVNRPLISGDQIETLIPWSDKVIRSDHGAASLSKIPKYDGFCNIPDHLDYKEKVGEFLNRYEPISFKPIEGKTPNFEIFLKHVFQDQYDLGLDYISLLYLRPTQQLPVLCLVSKERGTGKTTFLNILKAIFGANMTYNKNEDFRSQFNSDWASKLIIAVDEVLLDKREDSERIKNLSTAKTFKAEAKGKDRIEGEFFGKFILCSNNENNFIQIDPGETRYWVIKVHPFESEDVFLLDKLKSEIPAFLHLLNTRPVSTKYSTRMWFDPKLFRTPALLKVIHKNRSRIETELIQIVCDLLEEFELEQIEMCLNDPIPFLRSSGISYCHRSEIKEIFQTNWSISP